MFFQDREIFCPCRYDCQLDYTDLAPRVREMAEELREQYGAPLIATSSVRCKRHNDEIPGSAPQSKHIAKKAIKKSQGMDLHPIGGNLGQLIKLHDLAEKLFPNDGVGFYSWGVHIDCRGVRARW